MTAYMEEKYKEAFSLVRPYNGQFGKDYTMYELKSENGQDKGILVRRVKTGDQKIYQDNYLAFLLKQEIECRVEETANQVFGKCSVHYQIPELVFPASFPADMSGEKFLKNPWAMVKVTILPQNDENHSEEKVGAFLNAVREKGYVLGGTIRFPSAGKAIFALDEKGGIKYLEWRERREDEGN